MKILVCGGREFSDEKLLSDTLYAINNRYGITLLIHGDARGADRLAGKWATDRDIPVKAFPADWKKHGNRAGPIRNHQMLIEGEPEMVVAFPGGFGTADMVKRSRARGLTVMHFEAKK